MTMGKRVFSLVLVLALALGLCACGSKAPTWQEQYDLGVRYLSDGNYEEAILAFTAAIDIDPKRPEAYIGLADSYEQSGRPEQAIDILRSAIDLLGELPELLERLEALEGSASPQGDALPAQVEGSLELHDVTCVFSRESDVVDMNENAVAGLEITCTVDGPDTVCAVLIAAAGPAATMQQEIDETISYMVDTWKEEGAVAAGETLPFTTTSSCPLISYDLGQTFTTILVGLDEQTNAVGYALVTVDLPS